MHSELLFTFIRNTYKAATLTAEADLLHFGSLAVEADALANSAIVSPVNSLIRIRVTGQDRAKFLHSFCTNNVKELFSGCGCEAFFTDVKARVLAHGWILAGDQSHEIWMLPGDEQQLLDHLNRYIITEDVTLESVNDGSQAIAIMGPEAEEILRAADVSAGEIGTWQHFDGGSVFRMQWNDSLTAVMTVSNPTATETWQRLIAYGATPSGSIAFDHQRILEGIPLVGTDITGENLAPEADRITQAISYTKGCYLGQEPIARLDAMGHVNRKLRRAVLQPANQLTTNEQCPVVTSWSRLGAEPTPALLMLKTKQEWPATSNLTVKTPDGDFHSLHAHHAATRPTQ